MKEMYVSTFVLMVLSHQSFIHLTCIYACEYNPLFDTGRKPDLSIMRKYIINSMKLSDCLVVNDSINENTRVNFLCLYKSRILNRHHLSQAFSIYPWFSVKKNMYVCLHGHQVTFEMYCISKLAQAD